MLFDRLSTREQEAGKASSLGLPDLPPNFDRDKTMLDRLPKRSPLPSDSSETTGGRVGRGTALQSDPTRSPSSKSLEALAPQSSVSAPVASGSAGSVLPATALKMRDTMQALEKQGTDKTEDK